MTRQSQKLILFDIDHTLFDVTAYRQQMFEALAKVSEYSNTKKFIETAGQLYAVMRQHRHFDPSGFVKALLQELQLKVNPKILESIILSEDKLEQYLYEETEQILYRLSKEKNLKMGIFSGGDVKLQKGKIKKIEHLLQKEDIHIITQHKEEQLQEILNKYKRVELYLVDDMLTVLYQAKLLRSDIHTIWIRRDDIKQTKMPEFTPDSVITNLREIVPVVINEDKV